MPAPPFDEALARFRASAEAWLFEERQEELERAAERAFADKPNREEPSP